MSGIYIHIPFCDTKCIYCDFYSITNHSKKDEFMPALRSEFRQRRDELKAYNFDTVYFGGGTPSLLSYEDFQSIFEELHNNFRISPESEITIEANPGTLDRKKLDELKKLPINRLSFGVQSFIDRELKFLTRIHSSKQAINSVRYAQDAGFRNINVDLIFALPGQTPENWAYNLETALSLNTQHISAYSLIFEDGTYLKTLLESNKVQQADEETEAKMYEYTMKYLTDNNFMQYEVSNFARSGFECRHNLKYWTHEEYIGFGPSAASFVNNQRWVNVRSIDKYIERVKNHESAADGIEELNVETSVKEFIFLGLRSKGIDLNQFMHNYNFDFLKSYRNTISELVRNGLALLENNLFRLTPKGYALCDEIVVSYF